MTRDQALAPLGKNEGRFPITSGALVRGRVRMLLTFQMMDYYEEKSFLESTFIVRGPADKVVAFRKYFEENY